MPRVKADVFETTNPGILFTANNQTWVVESNITVSSSANSGVYSACNGSQLVNRGHILSTDSAGIGVYFRDGTNDTMNNAAGASIFGTGDGFLTTGASNKINNFGSIVGRDEYGVYFLGTKGVYAVNNDGVIFGKGAGVNDASTEGGVINNTGSVRGTIYGIIVSLGSNAENTVINNQGTIRGDAAAIIAVNGGVSLNNDGILAGVVNLSNTVHRDVVLNSGKITGNVFLGAGNDLFRGEAGGKSGTVFGEDGNDRLIGAKLADTLNGGLGKDTQTGNLGADIFDFDSSLDTAFGLAHDVITDFSHTQHDRINLSTIDANDGVFGDQAFVFRGTHGFSGAGQIRYVKTDRPGTANDTTTIFGNTDADRTPEFQIELRGLHAIVVSDFIL